MPAGRAATGRFSSGRPDSKKIATFQQDQRGVGEMYLVSTKIGHPTLVVQKYPLAGDSIVPTIQRVIIDVERRHAAHDPAADGRRTSTDRRYATTSRAAAATGLTSSGTLTARIWRSCRRRATTSTSSCAIADATTGAIRNVFDETVATQFESGNGRVNWHVLPASNEVIWFSERDNWGQLYLYDLASGKLKHQITTGEGNVTQLLRIDDKTRTLYFQAVGKEQGRDPYFRHFYRIGMDGKRSHSPHAGERRSRRVALAVRPVFQRHLFATRRSANDGGARCERQARRHGREGGHLAVCWRLAGSRPCRSP